MHLYLKKRISCLALCLSLPYSIAFAPIHLTKNNPRSYKSNLNEKSDPLEVEVVQDDDENISQEELDWLPDREKAQMLQDTYKPAAGSPAEFYGNSSGQTQTFAANQVLDEEDLSQKEKPRKRLTYTDEEEELIETLGGKDPDQPSAKREEGFLGDCTLKEIALDYQCPICYLADVLCGWGVPPPIDPDALLGDMITGEQAFAILEALHTLDMGALNDRYSEYDLATLCVEYDIELLKGFELAMKEGWNLPFGVRTYLRVEQEEFLVESLAKDLW